MKLFKVRRSLGVALPTLPCHRQVTAPLDTCGTFPPPWEVTKWVTGQVPRDEGQGRFAAKILCCTPSTGRGGL